MKAAVSIICLSMIALCLMQTTTAKQYGVVFINPDGKGAGTFNALSKGIETSVEKCMPVLAELEDDTRRNLRQKDETHHGRELGCSCLSYPPGYWRNMCEDGDSQCRRRDEERQLSAGCEMAIADVRQCIEEAFPGLGVIDQVFDKFGYFECIEFY